MKYFAYGSNCSPSVMERKRVDYSSRARASLDGYRLRFNKKAMRQPLPQGLGFANISEDPDGRVEGILYEITGEHLERLDASERYPDHYVRIDVTVQTADGPESCFTYQAHPDKVADGLRPSRNYLNHILAGRDFLSRQYYDALDKALTYEGECAVCRVVSGVTFVREGERLHMLCQPCREARIMWGDVRGRRLTVEETEAVMTNLVRGGKGFPSLRDLIREAIETKLIDP